MKAEAKSFGKYWNELTDEQREYFKDYIDIQKEAYHKAKVEAIRDEINKTWIDDKGKNRSFTSDHKKRLEQLLKQ